MTRDAAAQAVHERLERAVSSMPAFDVDAGWASLAAELEGPIAPVIPLRRRHPRRTATLAVAAAIFIGGSALAMVRHGDAPGLSIAPIPPIATLPSAGLVTGPHAHPAFSGAPSTGSTPTNPAPDGVHGDGRSATTGSSGGSGDTSGGSGGTSGSSGPTHVDSPDDTDHGTGNDGQHDDNGQGNDAQGKDSQSNEGSGGDQGSNGNGQ